MSIPVAPPNLAAAPIPTAAAVTPGSSANAPKLSTPVSEIDKQDFAALMKGTGNNSLPPLGLASQPAQPSFLESFATTQTTSMKQMFQTARDLSQNSQNMSMHELSMAGIDFKMNMAIVSTQFQLATGVGKSAGKGVDTLMRNQ